MSIDKPTILGELERLLPPQRTEKQKIGISDLGNDAYQRKLIFLAKVLDENEDMLYGLFWDEYTRLLETSETERRVQINFYMWLFDGIVQKVTPRAVRFAGGLLLDTRYPLRDFAAERLGQMGSLDAFPYLIAVIHDDDEAVAARAARALGEVGAVQAASLLVDIVTGDIYADNQRVNRAMIQHYALAGLSLLNTPYVYEAMKRITFRKDLDTELRTDVLEVLFRKYGAEVHSLLEELTSDNNEEVSDLAQHYLKELKDSA